MENDMTPARLPGELDVPEGQFGLVCRLPRLPHLRIVDFWGYGKAHPAEDDTNCVATFRRKPAPSNNESKL